MSSIKSGNGSTILAGTLARHFVQMDEPEVVLDSLHADDGEHFDLNFHGSRRIVGYSQVIVGPGLPEALR
jgi:hypothetical protein